MTKRIGLNVLVVFEALLLLAVTLGILAYFSHKALRQEALRNAEQTLEGTIQDVDNILMVVEQSTGNIYYDLLEHLDEPERMYTYSRCLVESNPNIVGCAICFKPGYFPGRDLFMAYVHRSAADRSVLVTSETFTNRPYIEQVWYTEPMRTGRVGWIDPLKGSNTENEPLISFCLPFNDKRGERVGVIAVDIAINQLSKIVLAAKPSKNGYSVLIAHNGSYIVHPDDEKLTNPDISSLSEHNVDASEMEAIRAMVAGEKGMKEFRRNNSDWFVFYRPFERNEWKGRSIENIGWSVGVVYPEEDIFDEHNILINLVVGIAILGMLVFFLLYSWMIHLQLKPLRRLAKSAQRVAEGNYKEKLPYSDRLDEIGQLQNNFEKMQHSLQNQVDELEKETGRLQQYGDMLSAAYNKTVETDRVKASFLHYLTSQLAVPAECIDGSVTTLCNDFHGLSQQETEHQVDIIHRKSQSIVELLNHIDHFAENDIEKEADND